MTDELLDIVDKNDTVIGQKHRSAVYAENLSNFRVVNAFIQNDKGELWIPRRSKNKRLWPLYLDASMGGHVAAGETYEEAFKRETMEELRIDISSVSHKEIAVLTPSQHNVSAFMKVFLLQKNEPPNYNPDDFIEAFWLKPQEIISRLEKWDKGKDDLPKLIKHLFMTRKYHL